MVQESEALGLQSDLLQSCGNLAEIETAISVEQGLSCANLQRPFASWQYTFMALFARPSSTALQIRIDGHYARPADIATTLQWLADAVDGGQARIARLDLSSIWLLGRDDTADARLQSLLEKLAPRIHDLRLQTLDDQPWLEEKLSAFALSTFYLDYGSLDEETPAGRVSRIESLSTIIRSCHGSIRKLGVTLDTRLFNYQRREPEETSALSSLAQALNSAPLTALSISGDDCVAFWARLLSHSHLKDLTVELADRTDGSLWALETLLEHRRLAPELQKLTILDSTDHE